MSIRNQPRDAAVFGIDIGKTVFHAVGLAATDRIIESVTARIAALENYLQDMAPFLRGCGHAVDRGRILFKQDAHGSLRLLLLLVRQTIDIVAYVFILCRQHRRCRGGRSLSSDDGSSSDEVDEGRCKVGSKLNDYRTARSKSKKNLKFQMCLTFM